jgi:ATP-dependent Lhr-like helicase
VTFTLRSDLPWLMLAKRGRALPEEPPHGPARQVLDALRAHGAMFSSDLPGATGRLPVEVQEGLWDLVARGIVTSDGFGAVRALFSRREDWARRHMPERRRLGLRPNPATRRAIRQPGEGRWALLVTGPGSGPGAAPRPSGADAASTDLAVPTDELAEQVASQLLARWGVVFWDLVAHEDLAVPWREILWALRRFEARGIARGGRFVTGFSGEQYALAEALDVLRHVTRSERKGELVRLSAADPLNLSGVVLPGKRVPAVRTNGIVLRDGLIAPVAGTGEATDSGAEAMEEEPAPA